MLLQHLVAIHKADHVLKLPELLLEPASLSPYLPSFCPLDSGPGMGLSCFWKGASGPPCPGRQKDFSLSEKDPPGVFHPIGCPIMIRGGTFSSQLKSRAVKHIQ